MSHMNRKISECNGLKKGSGKPITLDILFHDGLSQFIVRKIDPISFHGYKRRIALDHEDRECSTALLTDDGLHLMPNGCTAEMYLDEEGDHVERKEIIACDEAGNSLAEFPATAGAPQTISGPVPASEILEHVVTAVSLLEAKTLDSGLQDSLEAGEIYRTSFRPRKTYHDNPAFLLKGVEGFFLIVGERCRFEYARRGQLINFADNYENDDAQDFFDMGFRAWRGFS